MGGITKVFKKVASAVTLGASDAILGSAEGAEQPDAPGAAPDRAAADAAAEQERKRALARRGRKGTLLTGGQGDTSTATTKKAKLLGG